MRNMNLILIVASMFMWSGCGNSELVQCREENQGLVDGITEVQSQKESSVAILVKVMTQLKEANEEKAELKEQLDVITAQHDKKLQDSQEQGKKIEAADSTISKLNKEVQKLRDALKSLNKKMSADGSKSESLEKNNIELQKRISELEAKLNESPES